MSSKKKVSNKYATISSCLIVKNEVNNLPLLIDDLYKFSDEIIIVDTGSTDGTFEWLKKNQNSVLKVYQFEWIDNFAAARTFSFSKATKNWIFWCDADDRISEKLIDAIIKLKPDLNASESNMYSVYYKYSSTFGHYRNRLLRRSAKPYWEGVVHECVTCKVNTTIVLDEDCQVVHQHEGGNNKRNIELFEKNINNGVSLTTREAFCYAHEINIIPEKQANAQQIALDMIFREDAWEVLVWEAMIDVLANRWMSCKEQANIGIAILNRYEEINRLRGDIYYLRAVLYDMIDEKEKCIKDCYNAINTVVGILESYSENISFSKICPAMSLYNNANDDFTKNRMIEILNLYKDNEDVKKFLENIN